MRLASGSEIPIAVAHGVFACGNRAAPALLLPSSLCRPLIRPARVCASNRYVMFPDADVPVTSISVSIDNDTEAHMAAGRALQVLRDEVRRASIPLLLFFALGLRVPYPGPSPRGRAVALYNSRVPVCQRRTPFPRYILITLTLRTHGDALPFHALARTVRIHACVQGVLLVGSGEVVHNVPAMGARSSPQKAWCLNFEKWIERTAGVATETASRTTAATTTTILRQLDRRVFRAACLPRASLFAAAVVYIETTRA